MLKKCSSLLLALALITVLFTGCRGNAKNENQTGDPGTSTTSATTATKTADTTVRPTNVGSRSYSKEKVVWGPGNIADHARPQEPERLQKQFGALGARFLLDNKKQLCLTFDEGYENGYSGKIMDTLKEKQVHAIFFVTYDFASQNPALIKRMIAEGHVVGNHTYRHLTMDEVTRAAATEEITVLHRYMEKNYQYKMTYFRFPKGEFSEDTLALAQELGYKSIFWSFAYADWDTQNVAEPAAALQKVTESTHPGAIFLLHAVSPTNAEILGQAIDSIRSQGYTFTTAL